MIRLNAANLTVARDGVPVLNNIDAVFAPGEFTILIGPNGAGKSTMLAALTGLLPIAAGAVLMDDTPIHAIPRRTLARRRSYLPQAPRCEWPISVARLVALGLTPSLPALGDFSIAQKVQIDAALAACDLIALRDRPATSLSGGELSRAMLARALVSDPQVLLIDEPTNALDPRHAIDAMTRLRAVARDQRIIIAASHDIALAGQYATRIIALKQGRIIADGPSREIITADLIADLYETRAQVSTDNAGVHVRFNAAP